MYKAVIIDDEPIIVTGITKLLPWAKYECIVAGTAGDGKEGMELIRRLRPDIVISDIYMPKMDGMVMLAALKSEYEDMEVTVLTGYRDFELVQRALHLGVTRFVLKPSDMDELEEALQVMTDKLRRKGIHPGEEPSDHSGNKKEDPAGSFLVHSAVAYMRRNYRHKITLTDVAENIYVSQWHLSKLLNRQLGQSFSELLNSIRVEEAKQLLENPALRIGDVADEVGFLDLAHFSRVFKKMTGMSANEYRNQLALK